MMSTIKQLLSLKNVDHVHYLSGLYFILYKKYKKIYLHRLKYCDIMKSKSKRINKKNKKKLEYN